MVQCVYVHPQLVHPNRHPFRSALSISTVGACPVLFALVHDLDPQVTLVSLVRIHPCAHAKRHLDRFSRFCRDHDRVRPTDRQTNRATLSVAIGRI